MKGKRAERKKKIDKEIEELRQIYFEIKNNPIAMRQMKKLASAV